MSFNYGTKAIEAQGEHISSTQKISEKGSRSGGDRQVLNGKWTVLI